MDHDHAVALIAEAVAGAGTRWADLGAGRGTFTRALRSLLPTGSLIYAVDHDPGTLPALHQLGGGVTPVLADFTKKLDAFLAGKARLDGLLLANALHFVQDPEGVLRRLVPILRPGGRVVIVEYDRRAASQWVPYPIRSARWPALAAAAGLIEARVIARTPSAYAGELYVGRAERPGALSEEAAARV